MVSPHSRNKRGGEDPELDPEEAPEEPEPPTNDISPPESDDEGEIVELTGDTSTQGTPEITMQSLDDIEWGFYYKLCPKWSDFWNQTQGNEDWPEGVRVFDKKNVLSRPIMYS